MSVSHMHVLYNVESRCKTVRSCISKLDLFNESITSQQEIVNFKIKHTPFRKCSIGSCLDSNESNRWSNCFSTDCNSTLIGKDDENDVR